MPEFVSKSWRAAWLALIWVTAAPAWGASVAGVDIPDAVEIDGVTVRLNGAGVRTKFWIKVYVGALYLPERTREAAEAIAMDGPKRVDMIFLHKKVGRDKLVDAWNEGFAKNTPPEVLARLRPRIEQFNAWFTDAHAGDHIRLEYLPDTGTRVYWNDTLKGVIPGADFNQALLRIWLGDTPADADLKRALLGR